MKKKIKYLTFFKKDRLKFLNEVGKQSTRLKNILRNYDMLSYDSFYYHVLINRDTHDFQVLRNCGPDTAKEMITLMRKILNPDGRYDDEIKEFDRELKILSSKAKGILSKLGISLFETFYYTYVIKKEIIDFRKEHGYSKEIHLEVEKFVESFCNYLGFKIPADLPVIHFNPKNPKIPFVPDRKAKKTFSNHFNNLNKRTREKLSDMRADSFEGFYIEIISKDSAFNHFINKIGEQNLLEILRFRSLLGTTFKQIKNN
jgi:hypothetical protein